MLNRDEIAVLYLSNKPRAWLGQDLRQYRHHDTEQHTSERTLYRCVSLDPCNIIVRPRSVILAYSSQFSLRADPHTQYSTATYIDNHAVVVMSQGHYTTRPLYPMPYKTRVTGLEYEFVIIIFDLRRSRFDEWSS